MIPLHDIHAFQKKQDMRHLDYLGFARALPSAPLQQYVLNYWVIKRVTPLSNFCEEYLHPEGGMGIIFNLGDALFFDKQRQQNDCYMDGSHSVSRILGLQGKIYSIGIRFLAGGASAFFPMPLSEINNLNVNLHDLEITAVDKLYQQLFQAKSMFDICRSLESWLLKNVNPKSILSPYVSDAVQRIKKSSGNIAINSLYSDFDISQRQLERLFKQQLGMTAKHYSRLMRIQAARKHLSAGHTSQNANDYLTGFYDQAHFIHEFKTIIGITPSQYLKRRSSKVLSNNN